MQAFGWLMRAIGLLLICALLLLGLMALSELLLAQPSLATLSVAAARVWFVVLAVVVALVVLWLAWRVLRAAVLALASSTVFGDNTATRLIGLGVAALAFPQAMWALLNAPLIVLIELLRNLPERTRAVVSTLYASGGSGAGGTADSMPLEAALLRLTDLLTLVGAELARTLDRAAQPLSLVDAALALALWALVGQALRGVPESATAIAASGAADAAGSAALQPRLLRAWRRMSDTQRWRLGLGAVFVVGGFLSIASIVAIPWLKEDNKVPAGLTLENLQKALEGAGSGAAELNKLLPQDFAKSLPSPFEALDVALPKPAAVSASAPTANAPASQPAASSSAQPAAPPSVQPADPLAGYALQMIARTKEARSKALQRAVDQREELLPLQERLVKGALRAFETESAQPMSSQERLFFYRAIQRQVSDSLADQRLIVAECRRDIESAERDATFLARDAANAWAELREPADAARRWDRVLGVAKSAAAYERACTRAGVRSAEFVPPEAGSGWGPFGKMANWLLRTKSFALALITGMLGFGLLGASIAAYVRATPTTGSHDDDGSSSSGHELGRVVVRGFSAAVVLFLAVKGGLAVLTVGEQDPNAYVLFFLCLVGAVYSEDVWNWARTKFLGRIGNGNGGGDGKGGGKGDGKAAAAPAPGPSPPSPPLPG